MSKPKILVADAIAEQGIAMLQADPAVEVVVNQAPSDDEGLKAYLADLPSLIVDFDAIIVRSKVGVSAEVIAAAPKLRAIGRAGVGTDHIDGKAATARGILVMNTPTGNTISTAEHAFSLMLSMARKIPQAHRRMKEGGWDKNLFKGVEMFNKTLLVLGMGRIGTEFARRAMAFGMRVLAYDPYLSEARAKQLRVELVTDLKAGLPEADFITMHMPKTPETTHLLNKETLALCKKGVRIVNCARGGLVDEAALIEALDSGHVAGAALDVYEAEPLPSDSPLLERDDIVFTPHLGASTAEAQENVGIEIAQTIRDFMVQGTVVNAINMPSIDRKTAETVGPYLELGENLGRIASQIAPAQPSSLKVSYSGIDADLDTSLITRSVLKGYLERPLGVGKVNQINAASLAENLGLEVVESRSAESEGFAELIEVTVAGGDGQQGLAGTFFGGEPRLVRIKGRNLEADPRTDGCLFIYENNDTPGVIGNVGVIFGKHGINIASMALSRNQVGGLALGVLNLDTVPSDTVVAEILAVDGIESCQSILS